MAQGVILLVTWVIAIVYVQLMSSTHWGFNSLLMHDKIRHHDLFHLCAANSKCE